MPASPDATPETPEVPPATPDQIPPMSDALLAEWMLVFRDIRPSATMRTVERRKPAVYAAWLARAIDDTAAHAYALRWHAAGWTPTTWWQLAISLLNLSDHPQLRELTGPFEPDTWTTWPEIAAQHGALTTTIAFCDRRNTPIESKLHWASAERKLTEAGIGRPGELLAR